MNHNEIRHQLSEYIDEALPAEDKTFVEEHLKTCPECSEALEELRKTIEHVKEIEEVEPPAWMTQKIMAKVRAEQEKKKTFLQRLFFPIQAKLPLETLGVLFLAVTVFFVYQNMQPVEKYSETPIHDFSKQEVAPAAPDKSRRAKPKGALISPKEVPQKPEYKALDMKPAYEAPPPPVPAPVPEAAGPPALKNEPSLERKSEKQTASGFMQFEAPPKKFSGQGTASKAPAAVAREKAPGIAAPEKRATAQADMGGGQILTLAVSDIARGAARVEHTVKEYGGRILRKEPAEGAMSLTVTIDSESRNRFIDRLKTLGELKDIDSAEMHKAGAIELRIVKQVQQPE